MLGALAIVLAVNAPSEARGEGGHGFGGGHAGGVGEQHGFEAPHGFDGHHDVDGHGFHHDGIGVGPVYPFYGYDPGDYPPASGYAPPNDYWYCSSYGAYYPSVTSCPEAWVPAPTS